VRFTTKEDRRKNKKKTKIVSPQNCLQTPRSKDYSAHQDIDILHFKN